MSEVLNNFVGGKYVTVNSSSTFDLVDPVTGKANGVSIKSMAEDVDFAIKTAEKAFETWSQTTPSQRQKYLLDLASALEARIDDLVNAQARNTGQLIHMIRNEEIIPSMDQIRFFAGAARLLEGKATGEYIEGLTSSIRREPIGVVAQVAPWNYPFMMAIWKVIPAIAAGNTVVLKPSDTTPEGTLLFAEIAATVLPTGVFNVVLGDAETGALLVSHPVPAMVSITGSVRAGKEVALAAAQNITKAHLELGGKAPVIVFDDVDIEKTAEHIAMTGFFNAGQDCTAATRVIVHESIHDQFIQALVNATKKFPCGLPTDESAHFGPLNNVNQFNRIQNLMKQVPSHAKIETGGKASSLGGFYFEPTIISGLQQKDDLVQNEIFGPIITVQSFSDEADALTKANDIAYGLASSIWTKDHGRTQRFAKHLNFGAVWINTHIPLTAEMPHGGYKHSGYGKDLSLYGMEEYTRIKHVMSSLD